MKILILDIETAPNLAYVWGLWKQNIGLDYIKRNQQMLCWCAKWLGEKKIMSDALTKLEDDSKLALSLAALLDEADIVITYNGNSFDIPWLNAVMVSNNMLPHSPVKSIDLYRVVRQRFRFPSNKLDYVANKLGLGKKIEHEGYPLWTKCLAGNKTAWRDMVKYCKHDVVLTEKLYLRLRPWIKNHPNVNLNNIGKEIKCAACGSDSLKKNGKEYLTTGEYQRYKCNACGAPNRGRTMLNTAEDRRNLTTVM